jgi:hypothetical protein
MDEGYFNELYRVIETKPEVIFSGLMLRSIGDFAPHTRAPLTQAQLEMSEASMPRDAASLREAIDNLLAIKKAHPDVVPARVATRDLAEVGVYLQTQALRKAFDHLGYHKWKPDTGSDRVKWAGDVQGLYVTARYRKAPWKTLKELLPA